MTGYARLIVMAAAHVIACAAMSSFVLAGDLDPPVGTVSPTMLPLDEVEPRTPVGPDDLPIVINQPGSYFLTGNLVAIGFGQDAVTINASDVTFDMRGFAIMGSEVGVWDDGIALDAVVTNVSISNGTITDTAVHGISGGQADGCTVERVRVIDAGSIGLILDENSTVMHCIVTGSGSGGIRCDGNAVILGCTAENNGSIGIQGDAGSSISDCISQNNSSSGFAAGAGSSVANCTASGNSSFGFFSSGADCVAIGCAANANVSSGFSLSTGSVIESCSAAKNGSNGFSTFAGTTVRNCVARDNDGHGITAGTGSVIVGNTCEGNGVNSAAGAGIFVGNGVTDARIDGNTVTNNDIGIDLEGFDNLVIKNHASANTTTNFDFGPGNLLGPILTTANMNSNAHPHGNFDSN